MSDDEQSKEESEAAFQEQLRQFMEQNADLAEDLEGVSAQQQLFVELHEYYSWLKGGGFTTSEALEFLVIYLIKMLERFGA